MVAELDPNESAEVISVKLLAYFQMLAFSVPLLKGQTVTVTLNPITVTASRLTQPTDQVPFSVRLIEGSDLRLAPTSTLDGALRAAPGFSLFRRSDSLTANPTAQGVSLRGIGPSGASRTLILLDGVPLNDPFGGWVSWSKVPRESISRSEIVFGGGAIPWGNSALGGVVQLLTLPPTQGGRITATAGDFATRSVEGELVQSIGPGMLSIAARDFATNGFRLVAPENRGPVDIPAWSRHHWLATQWVQAVGNHAKLTIMGRTYAEKRGNGTALQQNASGESFGSILLEGDSSARFSWTARAYYQDQVFHSTFSTVNAARTAESPASDQFAVPAIAFGAAGTFEWKQEDGARSSGGVDFRRVRGETREHFNFSNGDFTRLRTAGGAQDFLGVYVMHERALVQDWRLTAGLRLDDWREVGGHRREVDMPSGSILRDEQYSDRLGLELSPSLGLVWKPIGAWRLRAAGQQAFRRPTLNELYRPFRVGNVITEANASLRTERALSREFGVDYTRGNIQVGATAFWSELHDAVGSVTLAHGPGTFPVVGFVPAGGIGRQRQNLDRLRVAGVEVNFEWHPSPAMKMYFAYLENGAVVSRVAAAPALAGKHLAQVPPRSATVGGDWHFGSWSVTPRVRFIDRQFEDDENQLVLGAVAILDLGVRWTFRSGRELFVNMENLGNARVETGRTADGIVSTGTPRLATGGVRWQW